MHFCTHLQDAIALIIIALNTIVAFIYVGYAVADVKDILRHPLVWLASHWARLRQALLPLLRCCGCAPKQRKAAVRPRKLRPWQLAWWADLHTPPRDGAGEDGWAASNAVSSGGSLMHHNPVALLDGDHDGDDHDDEGVAHIMIMAHHGHDGRRMGWASMTAQRFASVVHRTFVRASHLQSAANRRSIGGEHASAAAAHGGGGGRESMDVHDLHSNRNSIEVGGPAGRGKRRSLQLPGAPPKCATTDGLPSQGLHTAALLPSPTAAAAAAAATAAARASESGVATGRPAAVMHSASARVPAALSSLEEEPAADAALFDNDLLPAHLASALLSARDGSGGSGGGGGGAGSSPLWSASGAVPASQRRQSSPHGGGLTDLDALVSNAGGGMYRSNSRGGAGGVLAASVSGALSPPAAHGGALAVPGAGEADHVPMASLLPTIGLGLRQGSVTEIFMMQPPTALVALAASRPTSDRKLSRAGSTCGTPRRSTLAAASDTSTSGGASAVSTGGGGGSSVHGGGGGGGGGSPLPVQLVASPLLMSGAGGLATSVSVGGGQERRPGTSGGGTNARIGSGLRRSQLRGLLTSSALPFGAPPPLPVGPAAEDISDISTPTDPSKRPGSAVLRMQPKGFLTATVTSGTVPVLRPAPRGQQGTADGGADDADGAGRRVHAASTLTSALPFGAPPPLPPAPDDDNIELETLLEKAVKDAEPGGSVAGAVPADGSFAAMP